MKNGMFLRAQSHESARSVRVIQACFSRSLTSWHSLKAANILPILIKFIGLALSVVIAQSSFAAPTPGATPGSFNVSESGAANYSIPIAMPPSTAGMAPQLSLNYSSQGGNGLLGMGWSLGGLSAWNAACHRNACGCRWSATCNAPSASAATASSARHSSAKTAPCFGTMCWNRF